MFMEMFKSSLWGARNCTVGRCAFTPLQSQHHGGGEQDNSVIDYGSAAHSFAKENHAPDGGDRNQACEVNGAHRALR